MEMFKITSPAVHTQLSVDSAHIRPTATTSDQWRLHPTNGDYIRPMATTSNQWRLQYVSVYTILFHLDSDITANSCYTAYTVSAARSWYTIAALQALHGALAGARLGNYKMAFLIFS